MRQYQMQLSGPWPPYHFVHRLTRGPHSHPQPWRRSRPLRRAGTHAGGSHVEAVSALA